MENIGARVSGMVTQGVSLNLDLVDDPLVSVRDSARLLGGLNPGTVRAWLREGKLKPTRVGRRVMIRSSQLASVVHDE
jgi:hypothetical protein